jgi:DNA-binding CsgD family transcriptional regulator
LERLHGDAVSGRYAGAIAAHYRLAGAAADPGRAAAAAVRAAEAAAAVFAFEEADRYWQAAIALETARGATVDTRAALLERQAATLRAGYGDQMRLIDCLEELVRLRDLSGDTDAAARARVDAAVALTAIGPGQNLTRALAHLDAAAPAVTVKDTGTEAGFFHHALARVHLFAVRTEPGLIAATRARTIAEASHDERLWATVAPALAAHVLAAGRPGDALAILERGWHTADRLNEAGLAFTITASAAAALRLLRDPNAAIVWCERELARPRQAHPSGSRAVLRAYLARARGEQGSPAEARALAARPPATPDPFLATHFLDFALAAWDGDWEHLIALTEEMRAAIPHSGNRLLWAEQSGISAPALRAAGAADRAEAALRQCLAIARDGPHVTLELTARAGLALLLIETGRAGDAGPQVERCRVILANREDWRGLAGVALVAEAALAGSAGRIDEAERRCEEAVAAFARHGAHWDEAEAQRAWGQLLRAARRQAAAEGHFAEAAALYQRIGGGTPWAAWVARSAAGEGPPASRAVTHPAGLSDRELEVLRLIAAGKSNPEIAGALDISINTVYRHVNHVFIKINVGNRVEAATYAHRHGLIE